MTALAARVPLRVRRLFPLPQAVPMVDLVEWQVNWPADRVSLAGVVVTILGLYVLGVLGLEVLRW
jgi:hypothetical protein